MNFDPTLDIGEVLKMGEVGEGGVVAAVDVDELESKLPVEEQDTPRIDLGRTVDELASFVWQL